MAVDDAYWSSSCGQTLKNAVAGMCNVTGGFIDMNNAIETRVGIFLVFCFVLGSKNPEMEALLCCLSFFLPLRLVQDLDPMPIYPSFL